MLVSYYLVPDNRRYAIDSGEIKRAVGWRPDVSFEEMIEKTIKWYLDHHPWLKNVISGEYLDFNKKLSDLRNGIFPGNPVSKRVALMTGSSHLMEPHVIFL